MTLSGTQLIAGQDSAQSSATFRAVNPATGQSLDPAFHEAAPAEVDRACAAASNAADEIRRKPAQARASLLRAMADQIMALGDALVVRAMEETGLPRPRIEMERARTCNQLLLFAGVVEEGSWVDARIDRALPDRRPMPRPDLRRMLVPLGPVAVFGASNFPLAFSVGGGDSASALAAGCPVVCKGHPAHPGTSELVARACQQAVHACAFPPGAFSFLQGAGIDVGVALVRHPAIQAVGFTGSLRGGRALFDQAAKRETPIPVYAEMGSTNPVFILPGALRERADKIAEGLVASVTFGVGQLCTKPGMIFLPTGHEFGAQDAARNMLDRAVAAMQSAAPATMLHAGIHKSFRDAAARLGAIDAVETRCQSLADTGAACAQAPILFVTTAANLLANPAIADEVFGPSTLILQSDSRTQILAAARALHGHLTATLHATPEDLAHWQDLVDILQTKVGRIILNAWPTGVEVCDAMQHGGPYPATTDPRATSVGTAAITRWSRPLCWQNFPGTSLPPELQDANPLNIWRRVDGSLTRE